MKNVDKIRSKGNRNSISLLWAFLVLSLFFLAACSDGSDAPPERATTDTNSGGVGVNSQNGGTTGQGGSLARFTIAKKHLYVLESNQLRVYSLSNPGSPTLVNEISIENGSETIFSREDYLFIGQMSGMRIMDITNPGNPDYVSRYEHIVSCDPVVANASYAYVTLSTQQNRCNRGVNQLQVIDIRNIENPRRTGGFNLQVPGGLGLWGDHLYVCDQDKVLHYTGALQGNLKTGLGIDYIENPIDLIPLENHLLVLTKNSVEQYAIGGSGNLKYLSSINLSS